MVRQSRQGDTDSGLAYGSVLGPSQHELSRESAETLGSSSRITRESETAYGALSSPQASSNTPGNGPPE